MPCGINILFLAISMPYDAELNLVQARKTLARAKRDYVVARVNLERATGMPGEKGGGQGLKLKARKE